MLGVVGLVEETNAVAVSEGCDFDNWDPDYCQDCVIDDNVECDHD